MRPLEHISDFPALPLKPTLATAAGRAYGPYPKADGYWYVQDENGVEKRLGQATVPISQTAHGFTVGQPLYQLGDLSYAASDLPVGDVARAADLVVVRVIDANNLEAAATGVYDFDTNLPLTPGAYYYAPGTPGAPVDTPLAGAPVQRLFWCEGLQRIVVNIEPVSDETGAAVQQPETISTLAARAPSAVDASATRRWQTFTPGVDGTIAGGTIDLNTVGAGPVDATVELWEGAAGTGTLIETATVTGITNAQTQPAFTFAAPGAVKVGVVHSLSVIRATGTDTLQWWLAADVYPNGASNTSPPNDHVFEMTIVPAAVTTELPIVFPGNGGAVTIGKENDYYLDQAIGAIPAPVLSQEYAIGIIQANDTDPQPTKDAAEVRVSHFRGVDTGAGVVWLQTAAPGTDLDATLSIAAAQYSSVANLDFAALAAEPDVNLKNAMIIAAMDTRNGGLPYPVSPGTRVLLQHQADPLENGVYRAVNDGTVTRFDDFDTGQVVPIRTWIIIDQGDTYGETIYQSFRSDGANTAGASFTVGTDGNVWSEVLTSDAWAPLDPIERSGAVLRLKIAADESGRLRVNGTTGELESIPFSKNVADFTAGDLTLGFYSDDPNATTDGVYYPDLDPAANFTFPSNVGNNGRRVLMALDWAARAVATGPPNWITDPDTNATLDLPATGWPAEGTEFVWAIADETGNKWLIRTSGNIELSYVVPSFVNDADAAAGTVPGSLFQGTGTGDLVDGLYRTEADNSRTLVA